MGLSVIPGILFFCVLHLFYFVFSAKRLPPSRGAVSAATYHPGYLSLLRLTPSHADGPGEVFRMISPLCWRLCFPPYRRQLASS